MPFKKQLTLTRKTNTDEKYIFNYRYTELSPNSFTKNLNLNFNLEEIQGIKLGIVFPENTIATRTDLIQNNVIVDLQSLLYDISKYFKNNSLFSDKIIKVIQISCRSGSFSPKKELTFSNPDLIMTELIRKLDALKIDKGVMELYNKFLEKDVEHITYNNKTNLYTIVENSIIKNFTFYELINYLFYVN
jgi:hypothetical protein